LTRLPRPPVFERVPLLPKLRTLRAGVWLPLVVITAGAAAPAAPLDDPLAAPDAGALLVRPFKPRDYQGSPVVVRALEHPATGEMLLLAGTTLHVFDGTHWTAVPTDTPAVRCLAVDGRGRVWLGGVDQLGYAERDAFGAWHFQPLADRLPAAHRKLGRIWDCVATADSVWIGTETKVVRWHDDAFTVFEFPSTGTLLAAGGQVFFQIKNKSLQRWDGAAFRDFSTDPLVAGLSIMRLFATADGALEGMTSAGAFFRLRGNRVEPIAPFASAALGTARLVCALPRPGGGWYVGTDSAGLLILDREGRLARRVGRADGFTDGPIADLTRDRNGALWAATFSGPFQIEQPEAVSFFGPAQGLPENISNGLERHQGRLYVASPAGLLRLAPGRRAFELAPGSPRLPLKLLEQPTGLLIAHAGGVARLHDDRFTALFESDNPCTALAASRREPGALLVGRSAGFSVLRPGTDGLLHEVRHFPELGQVRDVIDDADGVVWIATSTRGIHRIVPAPGGDPWTGATVTTYDTAGGGLAGTSDSTLLLHTPFGLSFNTPSGHVRFDPAANRFVADERFRLGDRGIALFGITAVRGTEAWATANFGENAPPLFGRIEPTGAATARFLPAPASVQEVLGPIDGGRLLIEGDGARRVVWSRTVEGLARILPAALAPAPAAWSVSPTGFQATGAAQPLATAKAPRFAYSRQPYVFSFHAPDLERGAQVEYQTRLIGWDAQWSAPHAAGETRFSALPAGTYRFEARARDRLGRVAAPIALGFSVAPPPWLSGWAMAGYAFTLAGGMVGLVRWRVGRLERERLRLEKLVVTRTGELAAARDAAEAASRAKSAFLASMSHELRTPLNGVIGYAQLLQNDARLAIDQRERLRIVHQSGEHLLQMINDVLDLAKIEAGKIDVRPAPFALGEMLQDVAAAHAPAAAAKRLDFQIDLAADLPAWVEGDAQKLRQVLDNLLGNAVKFTAAGNVTLHVQRDGAMIACRVLDTGPGIVAADREKLFQPFEQARATRPAAPGTGLGLAISRALVERMGGHLTVASEPGAGSTFSFSLPLPAVATSVTAITRPAVTGYDGPRRRVLIVDDHAINRRLLVDLLAPLGFECADAASGEAALARLMAGQEPWPDLAIVDLRMAGLDGLELTRRLRAQPRGPDLRVLLTSASVINFDAPEARAAGCDDFLPKPFRTADLVEKIGALLALRWHEARPATGRATGDPSAEAAAIPEAARAVLREVLAQGDLEAFRAALARVRAEHPRAAVRWDELDTAAAGFQLSRLRALLDPP
jgi:signal transduction histidine kinase/DNA-binding response OmpR family regulator